MSKSLVHYGSSRGLAATLPWFVEGGLLQGTNTWPAVFPNSN